MGFLFYFYDTLFYILYSVTVNRFYTGETHNVEERLQKHKTHSYEGSFTKMADDWQLVLVYECVSKEQAVRVERFVKRMKSKIFIQKLIENPEILDDIISKF